MTMNDASVSSPAEYYRITYKGIVALLADDKNDTEKSGAYVGYGEIIQSRQVHNLSNGSEDISQYSNVKSHCSAAPVGVSSMPLTSHNLIAGSGVKLVRVDEVLTGGYAVDCDAPSSSSSSAIDNVPTQPLHLQNQAHGYLYTQRKGITVAERVDAPQLCEAGCFQYRVVSPRPVPILVGPAVDAPSTRALLLPNTVHEVCLRVLLRHSASDVNVLFLRLSQRKGWICDRILVHPYSSGPRRTQFVVQEVLPKNSAGSTISSIIPRSSPTKSLSSASKQMYRQTPRKLRVQGHGLLKDWMSNDHEKHSSDTTIDTAASPAISQLSEDDTITTAPRNGPVPNVQDNTASVQPNFFLMRVVAPLGLKILPHFQLKAGVNKRSVASPTPSTADSTQMKNRILPYGTLFEASKQISNAVSSSLYSAGAGLIQLSDNSGWAIIPQQEELQHQFGTVGNVTGNLCAIQEVGNAIMTAPTRKVWLRVIPRNGILVSCPPAPQTSAQQKQISPVSSSGGSSFVSRFNTKAHFIDSDGTSSIGGETAFSESSRMQHHKRGSRQQMLSQKQPIIIPCGTCVQVEDSIPIGQFQIESSPGILVQNFARIFGGQGWIPKHLDGESFAMEVEAPEIRHGSFWFRVQSRKGSVVRQGPSRKALAIVSPDNGREFRFECGEFLRASKILTVFYNEGGEKYTESFAMLYRKSNVELLKENNSSPQLLSQLTAPGEWVAVHVRGSLYLEECAVAPAIERHRAGWRYNIVQNEVNIRVGPSFLAEKASKILKAGDNVSVVERVTAHGDQVTWLRLYDGQGWCHDMEEDGRVVMIAHSLKWRSRAKSSIAKKTGDSSEYKGLISKLFSSDTASSIISL